MSTNSRVYDFEKIEAELREVRAALLKSDNPDTLLALREKMNWLEGKLEARDLIGEIQVKQGIR